VKKAISLYDYSELFIVLKMPAETKKILVAEDDGSMRMIVTKRLAAHNFQLVEAEDGQKTFDLWQKELPDLVLIDIMMPEMNGFQVIEKIRALSKPELDKSKVIVLTNLWSQENIDRAKELGIDGYIVKAYMTTEEIAKKVEEVLAEK